MGNDKSHALPFVVHTPQGHSLSSMGIRLHLPVSMTNLCDELLSLIRPTYCGMPIRVVVLQLDHTLHTPATLGFGDVDATFNQVTDK